MRDDAIYRELDNIRRTLDRIGAHESAAVESGAWVPVFSGFSVDPTGAVCRYALSGKLCTVSVFMPASGTSNANTFTVSAPFPAAVIANMAWCAPCQYYDNGARSATWGMVNIGSAGTVINVYKDPNGAVWTATGGKRAQFTLAYEIG